MLCETTYSAQRSLGEKKNNTPPLPKKDEGVYYFICINMKNRLKPIIIALGLVLTLVIGLAVQNQAMAISPTLENLNKTCTAGELCAGAATADPDMALAALVGNIIKTLLGLTGVIFLVLIIVAGDLWMTAGGNAERLSKARHIMINAIIGIVAVLGAYVATNFVVETVLTWVGA